MINKRKVLEAYRICIDVNGYCYDCPYYLEDNIDPDDCNQNALHDILELLKEQEPVEPRRIDGKRNHFIKCGNCNYDLLTGFQFCPHCGKAVKWE